jgi:hypothetical protein
MRGQVAIDPQPRVLVTRCAMTWFHEKKRAHLGTQ